VAQDVIINEPDCGTILGLGSAALKKEKIMSHCRTVFGRVTLEDIVDPSAATAPKPATKFAKRRPSD
jgi:DNA-directed RNA polymerase subunit beta'